MISIYKDFYKKGDEIKEILHEINNYNYNFILDFSKRKINIEGLKFRWNK